MLGGAAVLVILRRFMVFKVFGKFGKIVKEEFLWHRSGPRRGQPR